MNEMITELKSTINSIVKGDLARSECIADEPQAYGWHNPHFPPEYRKTCLSGKLHKTDMHTEIYYTMACWYERISGMRAPCDFAVYSDWKGRILAARTCEALTTEQKERLIRAIEIGTRRKSGERDPFEIMRILNMQCE